MVEVYQCRPELISNQGIWKIDGGGTSSGQKKDLLPFYIIFECISSLRSSCMNLLNFITNIKFFLLYKKNYFQQQIAYLFNSSLQIILNNFLWYNLLYIMIFERKIFCFPIRSDHVWVPRADFFFFFLIAMRSRRKKMTLPFRKRSINPRDLLANLCAPFNYRGALPPLLLRVNWVVASIIRTSEYRPYRWGFTALICGSAREFLLTL